MLVADDIAKEREEKGAFNGEELGPHADIARNDQRRRAARTELKPTFLERVRHGKWKRQVK